MMIRQYSDNKGLEKFEKNMLLRTQCLQSTVTVYWHQL